MRPDQEEGWEPAEVMCLTCLRRPSRPGSPYCSRTCRVLHVLRLVRVELLGLAALGLLVVACGSSTPAPRPTPAPSPAKVLSCAWYTPTTPNGQQVIVTATGPACGDPPIIEWIASMTHRTWITEGLALVPHTQDDLMSQMGRAGSVVRVWFTGQAPPTLSTAGLLSDDLQAAGWTPQDPQA